MCTVVAATAKATSDYNNQPITMKEWNSIIRNIYSNVITLGQAISDYNNRPIRLLELNFPLNGVSFRKHYSVKQPKQIALSD
jgi:hypothetical protein